MTLREYTDCLNHIGEAAWHLAQANHLAATAQRCYGVSDAFELARLALHALVGEVARQADRNYGFEACLEAFGDPGAKLDQQEHMLNEEGPAPYWKIATASDCP